MIRELFAVGLGGAAGSIVRYMLSVWLLGGHTLLGFPAGTFTVNAAGSLLIGILLETTNSAAAGWLLIAGFCGGFTTFSTFSAFFFKIGCGYSYTFNFAIFTSLPKRRKINVRPVQSDPKAH